MVELWPGGDPAAWIVDRIHDFDFDVGSVVPEGFRELVTARENVGPAEPGTVWCMAPPVLITEDAIRTRVAELAAQIDADYAAVDLLVLIGVLKGSFIFLADLTRRLTIPHRVEFLAVTSYGDRESEEAGSVRLLMDVRHSIAGADVVLVEDIVDTGSTLAYLRRLLEARRPRSLHTCTLLHKPERTEEHVKLDYLGFSIPDVWVVGYGLDYAERYRTLPYIGQLPPEMR